MKLGRSFNEYITERLRSSHSSYEQINQFSSEINILENDLLPEGSDLSTFIGKFLAHCKKLLLLLKILLLELLPWK